MSKFSTPISIIDEWLRGLAVAAYAAENDEQLLKTVDTWGSGPEGLIAWSTEAAHRRHPDQFSLQVFGPYMPGFNYSERNLGDAWICPANNMDYHAMTS